MITPNRLHPMQLKLSAATRESDLVITLDGALAAGDAVAAQVELLKLAAACSGRIVLDCARLSYVASVGLRALLALHRNAEGRSEGVVLAAVGEPVRHVLELAGLLSRFRVVASVDDALRR